MEESVRMLRDSLSNLLRADLLHRISGGYVVTLSVDEHFGRDDEGRRDLDARYEGEIPLKWNLAYDAITDPVTTSFTGDVQAENPP